MASDIQRNLVIRCTHHLPTLGLQAFLNNLVTICANQHNLLDTMPLSGNGVHNRLVNSRWHAYAMDASTGLCYIIANLSLLRLKAADSLHDSDIAATPGFVCMNTAPLADR